MLADAAHLGDARDAIARLLFSNIVPFWETLVDGDAGGYHLAHDAEGKWKGPAPKHIVTQARMVWFWSRLARAGHQPDQMLSLAAHGYAFLRDAMWDVRHGGFFWSVSADGAAPVRPDKHLYGQAFGLYVLAEYARASAIGEVGVWAGELFELLEEKAHDARHGGYHEGFEADWSVVPDAIGCLGLLNRLKLRNTHLHLLEAITSLAAVSEHTLVSERLTELIVINTLTVCRPEIAAGRDVHLADWTVPPDAPPEPVSYGHDVESIWVVREACRAVGLPDGLLLAHHRRLFEVALRYGFDRRHGGFYEAGRPGRRANNRAKVWWVQAEALLGALTLFRLTADDVYVGVFRRVLDWITANQADWEHGDWHERVAPSGVGSGDKAGPWKDPYHQGRAMIETLAALS